MMLTRWWAVIRYEARQREVEIREWFAWRAAWLLPRRLVYLAAIRMFAEASSRPPHTGVHPFSISFEEATRSWEFPVQPRDPGGPDGG